MVIILVSCKMRGSMMAMRATLSEARITLTNPATLQVHGPHVEQRLHTPPPRRDLRS